MPARLRHNVQYEPTEHGEARGQILGMLVEGNSLRATTRMSGVSINTVSKLLADTGEACAGTRTNVTEPAVQADPVRRDLVLLSTPSRRTSPRSRGSSATATCGPGRRSARTRSSSRRGSSAGARQTTAILFLMDLEARLANRVQLTTDGLAAYSAAIGFSFGTEVDWAVLQKNYGAGPDSAKAATAPPIARA